MQEHNGQIEQETQRRTVYTVYGQKTDEVKAIQHFLEQAGLIVFDKENAVELVQTAAPFREEELAAAFKHAKAVIVFLTGEEKARLCKTFQQKYDQDFEKIYSPQPTPEQLFEAGYAFGMFPKRTILVQIGEVRPFSDIAGRHILHFTGTNEDYYVLRTRLTIAGCLTNPDLAGHTGPLSEKDHQHSLQPDPQKVFVIHGRNLQAKSAMFAFLRALSLEPIDWDHAVALARSSSPHAENSPYTGETIIAGIDRAQAIIALLTGDDLVQIEQLGAIGKPLIYSQARPNVLFETGIARGRCPQRTILVQMGEVRSCRDIEGRTMISLTNSSSVRWSLIDRLRMAGCPVYCAGNWHSSGNFKVVPCLA
jgi:hypothetical protein